MSDLDPSLVKNLLDLRRQGYGSKSMNKLVRVCSYCNCDVVYRQKDFQRFLDNEAKGDHIHVSCIPAAKNKGKPVVVENKYRRNASLGDDRRFTEEKLYVSDSWHDIKLRKVLNMYKRGTVTAESVLQMRQLKAAIREKREEKAAEIAEQMLKCEEAARVATARAVESSRRYIEIFNRRFSNEVATDNEV